MIRSYELRREGHRPSNVTLCDRHLEARHVLGWSVWRVPTEIIDRVVGDRGQSERIVEAAKRYGVSRDTISKCLKAAGVFPVAVGTRCWLVRKETVDRVVAELGAKRWKAIQRRSRARRLSAKLGDDRR